jgi:hypothetical protein
MTQTIVSSTNLTAGVWYHVAGVVDGENRSLYINGQLDTSAGNPVAISTNIVAPIIIGRAGGGGYYFPGIIDDVRIYDKPLSAGEISILANDLP